MAATMVLLACLSVVAVVLLDEGQRRSHGDRPHDFHQLYVVSWNVRHGGPVYDPIATPTPLAAELGWSVKEEYSFANPPALVPILVPLATLPYAAAWWSLALFSVAAGWLAMYLTARELGLRRWTAFLGGGFLIVTLPYLLLTILNHVESLVLLLGTVGWIALRRGRLRAGGVLWGLCAAFKLFPALWILPLFQQPLRRAAWSALGAGAIAMLVGSVVVGAEEVEAFVTTVLPQADTWRHSPGNFSLMAATAKAGVPFLGWALALATGVITVTLLIRKRSGADHIWPATSAAALLISPLSWSYYFVLLGPCLLILATDSGWSRTLYRVILYFLIVSLLYWPYLLGSTGGPLPTEGMLPALLAYLPTMGLLVMLFVALARPQSGRQSLSLRAPTQISAG
jgi:hypothetical protein